MNIEERRMLADSIEVLEDVLLDKSNSEKFTRIGMSMEEKTSFITSQGFFYFFILFYFIKRCRLS